MQFSNESLFGCLCPLALEWHSLLGYQGRDNVQFSHLGLPHFGAVQERPQRGPWGYGVSTLIALQIHPFISHQIPPEIEHKINQ